MNIVLTISYDGSRFVGWQKTNLDPKKWPSIEYTLEEALKRILGHDTILQAASRTDRGVHADGQIVNFHTTKNALDLDRLQYSLNCLLPSDIRVVAILPAAHVDFHATLDAKAKEYHYKICYAKTMPPFFRVNHWHFPKELLIDKMEHGAQYLVGEHDFMAFRNMRKGLEYTDTIRQIHSIDICRGPQESLLIKITGTNFLYKMARNIAGNLAYVGCGKLCAEDLKKLLSSRDRCLGGMTAPSCGLTLHKVYYTQTR